MVPSGAIAGATLSAARCVPQVIVVGTASGLGGQGSWLLKNDLLHWSVPAGTGSPMIVASPARAVERPCAASTGRGPGPFLRSTPVRLVAFWSLLVAGWGGVLVCWGLVVIVVVVLLGRGLIFFFFFFWLRGVV